MSHLDVDEEYGLSSDSAGSWSGSNEQAQGLLSTQRDDSSETGRWRSEKTHEEEDNSSAFSINRWWKLLLFLILWTIAIPVTVRFIHKDSYRHASDNASGNIQDPATQTPVRDEYVLDPQWDFGAEATLREYIWNVTETEYNPDGVFRPMLLINNQFPGPLIEANEHDTIRVIVHNRMSNSTAFHWHGIYQNGSNFMDGTVGVTQCPISPGSSFTYEFKVENQSGTYWYHAHQGVQASDGLVGPLVIHSKDEKSMQELSYATDRVVMISDHYYDISGALVRPYLAPDAENAEPVPASALINGRAIRNCDDLPNRNCDNSTANVGIPTFNLEANQQHRLRIINVGAFAEFQIQLDEHEMAVTEVDGTDVHPIYYHRLNINPAQRYSIIVNTNVTTSQNFRMRAKMVTHCFAEPNPETMSEIHAIVHYGTSAGDRAPTELPNSSEWTSALDLECRDLNTTELVPVQAIVAPSKPDAFFYLRSNFEIGAYRLSRGFFNTSSWRPDVRSPMLSRAVEGLQTANSSFDPASSRASEKTITDKGAVFVNDAAFDDSRELVIQSSGIQTIDVLVSNFDDGNHPMHLHGYKYFVLAQGHGAPAVTSLADGFTPDNLAPTYGALDLRNPLRRDTASVEAFGWLLLRFVADNPGAWAFHCHISWHTEAGLLMQFLTRTDELAGMRIPEANGDLCMAEGLEKGAGPRDEDYYDEA
ncbi:hypothetical protein MBLNU459_g4062t1 [Dothideomycetes sp. NU459]